jgi:hypothetical protein
MIHGKIFTIWMTVKVLKHLQIINVKKIMIPIGKMGTGYEQDIH